MGATGAGSAGVGADSVDGGGVDVGLLVVEVTGDTDGCGDPLVGAGLPTSRSGHHQGGFNGVLVADQLIEVDHRVGARADHLVDEVLDAAEVLGLHKDAASKRYIRALQRFKATLESIPGIHSMVVPKKPRSCS